MTITPFRPVLPNVALVAAPDTFFEMVRERYLDYRHSGMFIEHPREALLVYRLRENHQTFLGVIAAVSTDEVEAGAIRPHEGTLAASEQQQLQLLLVREAEVKPVLLTYRPSATVDALLAEATAATPLLHLRDGPTIEHTLFEVEPGSDLGARLQAAFAKTVPATYIADGHHRCSTAALYNRQRRAQGEAPIPLLAALFSAPEVTINAYHRVAQLAVDLSPLTLMARLSRVCEIEPMRELAAPARAGELTMFLREESFRLRWRADAGGEAPNDELDAGRFNRLIAAGIFGVTDIRTDLRIGYVPGTFGLRGMLDRLQHRADRVGFLLYPIAPEDMFAVVDAGGILPPKSTWFEPRMRNGLVVLEI